MDLDGEGEGEIRASRVSCNDDSDRREANNKAETTKVGSVVEPQIDSQTFLKRRGKRTLGAQSCIIVSVVAIVGASLVSFFIRDEIREEND